MGLNRLEELIDRTSSKDVDKSYDVTSVCLAKGESPSLIEWSAIGSRGRGSDEDHRAIQLKIGDISVEVTRDGWAPAATARAALEGICEQKRINHRRVYERSWARGEWEWRFSLNGVWFKPRRGCSSEDGAKRSLQRWLKAMERLQTRYPNMAAA